MFDFINIIIMRIRLSKHKTEASDVSPYINEKEKYIVQHCLEVNKNCLTLIKNGLLNKSNQHIEEMMEYIKQLPETNSSRNLKRIALNTKAFRFERMKQFNSSLQCLKDASKIQETSFLQQSKNLLNQCTIQSRMGNHKQAIKMAKQALQTLRKRQNQYTNRVSYSQICELVVLCFFNIGTELTNLNDNLQAQIIYKKGLEISVKHLGVHHSLTSMLKKTLENVKKQDKMKTRYNTIQKDSKLKFKPNHTKNYINFNKSIFSKNNRYRFPTIDGCDKSNYFQQTITSKQDPKQIMNQSFNPQVSKKFFGIQTKCKQRRNKTRLEKNQNQQILIKDKTIQNEINPQEKRRKSTELNPIQQATKSVQKKQGCQIM